MAYSNSYNPDALPAHAEPEQAAALLSGHQLQNYNRPTQPAQPSYNKPQPPLPRPAPQPGQYSGSSGQYGPRTDPYINQPSAPGGMYNSTSPPPSTYELGPRPQSFQNRPPASSRPPAMQTPPAGADTLLFPLFRGVDKNGNGRLSEAELRSALVNSDFTSFDPHTVRMMIRMFDADKSRTIGFEEFCKLWGFLASWRSLFDRFDEDRSGNISFDEYSKALVAFGYRLSPQFVKTLFSTYDKKGTNAISFDLFIQSCISLKRMTDVFKKFDDDRDG